MKLIPRRRNPNSQTPIPPFKLWQFKVRLANERTKFILWCEKGQQPDLLSTLGPQGSDNNSMELPNSQTTPPTPSTHNTIKSQESPQPDESRQNPGSLAFILN